MYKNRLIFVLILAISLFSCSKEEKKQLLKGGVLPLGGFPMCTLSSELPLGVPSHSVRVRFRASIMRLWCAE